MKTVVSTPLGPSAIGPYSQAIRAGNLLFVSGQIPIDPSTGKVMEDKNIRAQTRRVMLNLQAILQAGGASLADVVKTTVFLKDMNEFSEMNAAYAEFFDTHAPARATVEVSRLPRDAGVEIDCVAVIT